jgi:rRNA-processing protein FCF1
MVKGYESGNSREGGGMFDGFEGYRTPTEADYRNLLTQGLVVLDTNVLLDLYRMNLRVRTDMLTILDSLQERIWVPRQVIEEFWRNQQQDGLLNHHQDRASAAKTALTKAEDSIRQAISRWAKEVHLGDDAPVRAGLDEHATALGKTLAHLAALIGDQAESDTVPGSPDTNKDPVIRNLTRLLDGRVGAPMTTSEREQAITEAASRASEQQPPGYRDFEKGKEKEAAAGDYLVARRCLVVA